MTFWHFWVASRVAFLLFAFALIYVHRAPAHVNDMADSSWMNSLTNRAGKNCCNTADSSRLDDVEWRCEDDQHCEVFLSGVWQPVPPEALLDVRKNRGGYAIIWTWIENGLRRIRCFLPGTMT